MAQPTIVIDNATGSAIELKQLAVIVPASGSVTVSDFDSAAEVLNDTELQVELDAGNVTITFQGVALTLEQSKAIIQPITALDIKHNLSAVVDPVAATSDETAGYSIGSIWVNTASLNAFVCLDPSVGAAFWYSLAGSDVGVSTMIWGGNMTSAGNYPSFNGVYNSPSTGSLSSQSEGASSATGFLARLSWNTDSADATTVLNVLVNGIVVETVMLTGNQGSLSSVSASVTAGTDLIAVQYDSGTAPTKGTYSLGIVGGIT